MWQRHQFFVLSVLAAGILGCGKSDGPGGGTTASIPGKSPDQPQQAAPASGVAQADSPAACVTEFLEAMRTGNDEKFMHRLSPVAKQKAVETGRTAPPASDTARYEIGQVEYLGDNGARVATSWTDVDGNNKPQTDEALWIVRREADGWRIVGVAAIVFKGEEPLLLDFEKPEEMEKKQEWLRQEVRRRAAQEASQVEKAEKSPDSLRR